MNVLIVVSAYNESEVVANVIRSIKSIGSHDVLVVDDGSSDETYAVSAKNADFVVRHKLNRGLGGAIGTGLAFAKRNHYDVVVTMDADGQHDPADIEVMLAPILSHDKDVVIGTRMRPDDRNMPIDRILLNTLANYLTFMLFGIRTTDSQSGFRAFGKKAIQRIELKTERMEVSTEIFSEIRRHNLAYAEVPIRVIYTPYSRTKGQSNRNAFNIVLKLLLRIFR